MKNADKNAFIKALDSKLRDTSPLLLAIDGRCGSGKSTLAQELMERYSKDAALISMDDFYLPFNQRTQERMAQPGGHMDLERFLSQVLHPLKQGIAFHYDVFDCSDGSFRTLHYTPAPLTIIEGSYSLHPLLRDMYDMRVFMTTDRDTQRQRLLAREGEEKFKQFEARWIPREEEYLKTYQIQEKADYIITT